MIKLELLVEEKSFESDKGENVNYISCTANVGGETIRFVPVTEDKKLFKFLISEPKKNEEEAK